MVRPVENDDFCCFMADIEREFASPFTIEACGHFDEEEDTCDIDECPYSEKWLKWFKHMEAVG